MNLAVLTRYTIDLRFRSGKDRQFESDDALDELIREVDEMNLEETVRSVIEQKLKQFKLDKYLTPEIY